MDSSKVVNESQKLWMAECCLPYIKKAAKPIGWFQEAKIGDRGVAVTVL